MAVYNVIWGHFDWNAGHAMDKLREWQCGRHVELKQSAHPVEVGNIEGVPIFVIFEWHVVRVFEAASDLGPVEVDVRFVKRDHAFEHVHVGERM